MYICELDNNNIENILRPRRGHMFIANTVIKYIRPHRGSHLWSYNRCYKHTIHSGLKAVFFKLRCKVLTTPLITSKDGAYNDLVEVICL